MKLNSFPWGKMKSQVLDFSIRNKFVCTPKVSILGHLAHWGIYPEINHPGACVFCSQCLDWIWLTSTYSECWTDLWLPSIRINKEITVAQQINYGLSLVIIIVFIFVTDWLGRSWRICKYGFLCFADRKTVSGSSLGLQISGTPA